MKKLLAFLTILAIMLSTCIMGIGTAASALTPSPESDFIFFDGVIEDYQGPGGVVVIPQSIDGEEVFEIAQSAFENNTDIQEVHIPEGITTIGRLAFSGCTNLHTVTLPYSLRELKASTFSYCAIEEIVIPGNVDYIGNWCFSNNNLTKITISYGVRRILNQAFCMNPGTDVVFPETVEVICAGAFAPQKDAERVTYTICNPDCEYGVFAGETEKANENSEWIANDFRSPFASPYGNVNYKVIVPEESNLHKFLKEHDDGNDLLEKMGGNYATCSYSVAAQDEDYFDNLKENQKDWGITEPTGELWTPSNNDNDADNDSDTNNGDDADGKNTSGSNKNNNKNDKNNNPTQTVVEEGDNSLIVIVLIVVGGIILLIIIGVVVFAVLFLKKPKKAVTTPSIDELKAQLAKAEAAAAAEEDAPSEEN